MSQIRCDAEGHLCSHNSRQSPDKLVAGFVMGPRAFAMDTPVEIVWTDYMQHRARLRGFDLAKIERINE